MQVLRLRCAPLRMTDFTQPRREIRATANEDAGTLDLILCESRLSGAVVEERWESMGSGAQVDVVEGSRVGGLFRAYIDGTDTVFSGYVDQAGGGVDGA